MLGPGVWIGSLGRWKARPRITALGNGMFIRIIWGSGRLVFHNHLEVRAIEFVVRKGSR